MEYKLLKKYGLSERFEQESTLYEGLFLARVINRNRNLYKVICENGVLNAEISGKLIYNANGYEYFPEVGDWVMIDRENDKNGNAVIHNILRRKSVIERKAAGTSNTIQILAANIDIIFICMSLNADFNLRRLERYLTLSWESKAKPVVVLTKSDLCKDLPYYLNEIKKVSLDADIIYCNNKTEDGFKSILTYVTASNTIVFIGSSGVGKSTIINKLIGKTELAVNEIGKNDKGKHTTTSRQLLLLPKGGIVIDTPGMRELQINSGNISVAFEDIESLALKCKFSNCTHTTEPYCEVKKALEKGIISKERFLNYQKLKKEISYEGLNSKEIENKKINNMFGSKANMKKAFKDLKNKHKFK